MPANHPPGLWLCAGVEMGIGAVLPCGFSSLSVLINPDATPLGEPPVPELVRGDSNGDELLNIADTLYTLAYLFLMGPSSQCPDAADANDDGSVNLGDPVYIVSYLFLEGSPPPPPFVTCGVDPTLDAVGCDSPPCP